MAVASPNDLVWCSRGLHPLGQNESLSPWRLVAIRDRACLDIPSALREAHDIGDRIGIFLSGKGWRAKGWPTGRMHGLVRNSEVIGRMIPALP
jgi:hypothetical protein